MPSRLALIPYIIGYRSTVLPTEELAVLMKRECVRPIFPSPNLIPPPVSVETIRGLAEGPLAYDVYVLHATLEGKMYAPS